MIFAAGFVVAFIILLVFNMRHRDQRACRWRERRQGEITHWTCIQCGAEVDGVPGKSPDRCLAPGKDA